MTRIREEEALCVVRCVSFVSFAVCRSLCVVHCVSFTVSFTVCRSLCVVHCVSFTVCRSLCVGLGSLSLSIEGASKADIECSESGDGRCCVTYHPTAPGLYVINILFADQPVQGTTAFICLSVSVCMSVCLSVCVCVSFATDD